MRLTDPLPVAGRTAPSRVLFGPHETNLGAGRSFSPRHVAYYARRRPATSFMWSSMYRALPEARAQLLASLTGPDRAAWIVQWNETTDFSLDADGRVAAAIKSGYRRVAIMCDKPILLRRDRTLPSIVMPTEHCPKPGPQQVFGDVPVTTGFARG